LVDHICSSSFCAEQTEKVELDPIFFETEQKIFCSLDAFDAHAHAQLLCLYVPFQGKFSISGNQTRVIARAHAGTRGKCFD